MRLPYRGPSVTSIAAPGSDHRSRSFIPAAAKAPFEVGAS